MAALAVATLACRTVVIVPTGGTPGARVASPAANPTPAPPVEPTFAPGVVTVEALVPTFNPLGDAGGQIVTLAPSPEGPMLPGALYFLSDRGGRAQVHMLPGNGAGPRPLTDEPLDVLEYALDPEGMFLVARTARRVLIVYNRRVSSILDVQDPNATVHGMALSPNGARLAFWTGAALSVYQIDEASERFLRLVEMADVTSAAWSLDSAALAYAAPDGVHLLDMEAGRDRLALPAEAASGSASYRVDGATPDGRWFVVSTAGTDGECRARLVPVADNAPALSGLPCPLTFSPDGQFALWTPVNPPTIQVARIEITPGGEGWRTMTAIADYAAYAPSWPLPDTSMVWTCAFLNRACPAGTLDVYTIQWPSAQLKLHWDSAFIPVLPRDGGAAPADPRWETFAVVYQDTSRAATGILVVTPRTGATQVVADEGNNWSPQWFIPQ